jgi:hypothetical protein
MIRLVDARRIIAAAEKESEEVGQPMNVAVVDEGGNLIAFERMANAWLGSIDIVQKRPGPLGPSISPPKTLAQTPSLGTNFSEFTPPTTARS